MSWDTFFFRRGAATLLGCHHAPQGRGAPRAGVVVVPPVGHEYVKLHRSLRLLAELLAEAGLAVLRFDLSATGDSSGACEEALVESWLEDVAAAIAELRARSGVDRVGLVGVRLGGALAALAAARHGGVGSLALWDPVVDGAAYLEELRQQHAAMLDYAHVTEACDDERELLGFAWGDPLRRAIGAIDLLGMESSPCLRSLVVESHPGFAQDRLVTHLERMRVDVRLERLPAPEVWRWVEDFSRVQVPRTILLATAKWIGEVGA